MVTHDTYFETQESAEKFLSDTGYEQWHEDGHTHVWQHRKTRRLRYVLKQKDRYIVTNNGTLLL